MRTEHARGIKMKELNPLITVIVPIYNSYPYLKRCIDSIRGQAYQNLEIILVDDGSTDGSKMLCDSYLQKDRRIQVIHKENGGLVSARKAGLLQAQGEYIGFVDSDDYIDTEFYSLLLTGILETDSDISQIGYISEKGEIREKFSCGNKVYNISENRQKMICEGLLEANLPGVHIFYNVWSKLFRATLIKECYNKVPDSLQFGEDLICICQCMMKCNKIVSLPYEQYHYMVRKDSLSNGDGLEYFVYLSNLYKQLCIMFENNGQGVIVGKQSADRFFVVNLLERLDMLGIEVNRYIFPQLGMLFNKKVILYGAGTVGKDYYAQISKYKSVNIVAMIDQQYQKKQLDYIEVAGNDKIKELDYDFIVIAVNDEDAAVSIKKELLETGVLEDCIIWEKPKYRFYNDLIFGAMTQK